jgi:hypothetical protein
MSAKLSINPLVYSETAGRIENSMVREINIPSAAVIDKQALNFLAAICLSSSTADRI